MAEKTNAPLIGDFKGPVKNTPREDSSQAPAKAVVAAASVADMVTADSNPVDTAAEPAAPTAPKSYEDRLKEVKLTVEEARKIMDEILIKGHYTRTDKIGPYEVIIRSRTYNDTLRAQKYLEVENPTYQISIQDALARYQAAASLVKYGPTTFDHPEDSEGASEKDITEAFEKRYKFLLRLPVPVVGKIMDFVRKLDIILFTVLDEGSVEDF